MYAHWASLQDEIQFDKANKSVLHKFPSVVGRDVACSVVKHIAQNLSINVANCDPSNLDTETEVKWTMEVLCYGLSLPLLENDTIKDCVNVYCEWLSALTSPKLPVPRPVQEDPNPYAQDMLHHLLNLFVPRPGSGADLVKRQALMCHRVLRTIESVAKESAMLTRTTWETLLKFLLAANDSLLSPPTEKDDIGDHLCERVLSVLFELWLLACQKCFPSPSLWKTFRKMCIYWRHHEALITQWHRVNHALTAILLKFMFGPDYPELVIPEDDGGLQVPADIDNDCIAQSWFRFLHIIQNPVDLAKPELISQTPMFLRLALESEVVVDPRQHECLHKLPQIFYKAMRGVSIMVNAFLGIPQDVKDENQLTNLSFPQNRTSSLGPPTPPGQRKSGRPLAAITGPLTQRVSKSTTTTSKSATTTPQCLPGLLSLDSRMPLAPNRPKCNSILHLFGTWLFDASFANVKINSIHKNAAQTHRRTNSLIDHSRPTSLSIDMSPEKTSTTDNTYEAGRAEACGTLCRIFCAHKTGEEILPAYYSRFYFAMFYGLQTDENISGPVLSNILFNSCDLLRVDLAGAQILVPSILNSLELVLTDLQPKFRISEQIPPVELRKACVHLLLSLLCLPLHFKDLEIKDILSNPGVPEQNISFIALKTRIIDLLLKALLIETDSANTQMLLGGLMLTVQDMALCEQAESTTIQPQHVEPSREPDVHADVSHTSVKSDVSSDSSYQESSYHRLPTQSQENDTAYGLFGQATSLVCNRLMASWKSELSTALAAMELLSGLAKVTINPANMLMCKRTVKWICDFIVFQCSRPAPYHSRDLHSMIVAAFRCLTLWLVEHNKLLYDKECLHNVLEVVELGISGSKSQRKSSDTPSVSVKLEKDAKSLYTQVSWHHRENKASDPPKYKGEKDLMPASMRVRDAAEAVLTCIIDQVGAFPPPCGPESLFSLLDEKSLLKYAKGTGLPEQGSPFRYFVLDNSIIIGLLEQPLGNYEDPLPTVTALIRGPFGRHAWTMQLRHSPRTLNKMSSSKSSLFDPGRPIPVDNLGVHHVVKHKYFPDSVDKIPLTMADKSIPSLDSLITDNKMQSELDKLKRQIEQQTQFETNIARRSQVEAARRPFPNPVTECKPPKLCQEFQTARLFLSHYGFLSLEALKQPNNSSLPPALVMLDTSNAGLFADLESLDSIPSRDSDTVHVFYVKSGQKSPADIVANVSQRSKVQPQFLEFLHSLGWPVDIGKHAGWTGHISTSWKIMDQEDITDEEFPSGTGGSVYDGRQQVLYWADVMSEIAFVVPSTDTYNRYLADPLGDKSPQFMKRSSSVTLTKPRSLTQESIDKARLDKDGLSSPTDVPTMRNKRGRQPAQMMGPDTKVFVIWLENFEDHENFPAGDLIGVASTGLDHYVSSSSVALSKSTEKDVLLIFIHALKNGLFRIHMQGQTGKLTMAIPLVDGMVVSRRCLGNLVRQTAINICKRKRLESEQYQPPHVRRKFKIQEIVKNYQMQMESPDFYTSLFQDVSKE